MNRIKPARLTGIVLLVLGVIVLAFNGYVIATLGLAGPQATLLGPFFFVFGAVMAAVPGEAHPDKLDGPITTVSKTLRGLKGWEGALWIAGGIGGIALGVLWRMSL